eukprot:GILI01001369.1.p1 GENE.GILI01001369.1~~GILI01001369.1.p1  ORF type:complete len:136 (-),score=25.63 GILI01001369.1:428-835(-)
MIGLTPFEDTNLYGGACRQSTFVGSLFQSRKRQRSWEEDLTDSTKRRCDVYPTSLTAPAAPQVAAQPCPPPPPPISYAPTLSPSKPMESDLSIPFLALPPPASYVHPVAPQQAPAHFDQSYAKPSFFGFSHEIDD